MGVCIEWALLVFHGVLRRPVPVGCVFQGSGVASVFLGAIPAFSLGAVQGFISPVEKGLLAFMLLVLGRTLADNGDESVFL